MLLCSIGKATCKPSTGWSNLGAQQSAPTLSPCAEREPSPANVSALVSRPAPGLDDPDVDRLAAAYAAPPPPGSPFSTDKVAGYVSSTSNSLTREERAVDQERRGRDGDAVDEGSMNGANLKHVGMPGKPNRRGREAGALR